MDGRLFEAGRLLTFSAFRVGACSRWALIRGWALIRINTVFKLQHTCTIKVLKNVAKCPRKDAFSKPAYLSPTNGKL